MDTAQGTAMARPFILVMVVLALGLPPVPVHAGSDGHGPAGAATASDHAHHDPDPGAAGTLCLGTRSGAPAPCGTMAAMLQRLLDLVGRRAALVVSLPAGRTYRSPVPDSLYRPPTG